MSENNNEKQNSHPEIITTFPLQMELAKLRSALDSLKKEAAECRGEVEKLTESVRNAKKQNLMDGVGDGQDKGKGVPLKEILLITLPVIMVFYCFWKVSMILC